MADALKPVALRRAEWWWSTATTGLTAADVTAVFSPAVFASLGWTPAALADALTRARSAITDGAELVGLEEISATHVLVRYRTAAGLELEDHLQVDPDDGLRLPTVPVTRLAQGGSITALWAAGDRAVHAELEGGEVLADTHARRLAGEFAEAKLAMAAYDFARPSVRIMVCARSRFAEDTLLHDYQRGTRQYVVLGAGLDSFALRLPDHLAEVRVFEVDQPSTQSWKRRRIADSGIPLPSNLSFVAVDFEAGDLAGALAEAGFDRRFPAVVAWLGVVYYLSTQAISDVLREVAGWAPGTAIVFDYFVPEEEWDSYGPELAGGMSLSARSKALEGEPWLSFFSVPGVEDLLTTHGFSAIDHLDADRVLADYLTSPAREQVLISPLMRVVRASVPRK